MGIESYFLAAGANTALFPERMAPSSVNDNMRTVQSHLREWYNDPIWVQYGDGDGTYTATYASASSFTLSGDVTAAYHANRRLKITGATTGTVYGKVSSSSYTDPNTTINVTLDSGTLQNETLTVWLSAIPATNSPIPGVAGTLGDVVAYNVGTSGGTVPLLSGTNTWANAQTFSGNVLVGGTLGVTGAGTFSSTLAVTGAVTLSATLAVTGAVTIGGDEVTSVATSSFADTAAAQAGTSTTVVMNPATTKSALDTKALMISGRSAASTPLDGNNELLLAQAANADLRRLGLWALRDWILDPFEQTLTSWATNTAYEYTHSLGAEPEHVELWYVNKVDHLNFVVGEKVKAAYVQYGNNNQGPQLWKSETEVGFRLNTSGPQILDKTSGTITTIDDTNWNLLLVARL